MDLLLGRHNDLNQSHSEHLSLQVRIFLQGASTHVPVDLFGDALHRPRLMREPFDHRFAAATCCAIGACAN